MAAKNKTRYALLGVLSLMSGSGYDIKKFCDKSISHFWNENFGHIYPVLEQLEEEGLVKQADTGETGRRKVYDITEKGKDEFVQWLIQPPEYQPVRSELLLKLAFGYYLPKEKVLEMVRETKDRKAAQLEEYKKLEASYKGDKKVQGHDFYPYLLAPLRYGILANEAAIAWCEETIESIERYAGDV